MPEKGSDLLRRFLQDAITVEKSVETQFRDFAAQVDDDEVQALFGRRSELARLQIDALEKRLGDWGSAGSAAASGMASILNVAPQTVQLGNVVEERTLQNLIAAYTVEAGECAMYRTLGTLAHAAGDALTEGLARQMEQEARAMAEKIWHLLPSRSKIAFNMLTVSEIDPSVETKMADDRVIGP